MEKEFFVNGGCNFYGMEIQPNELNSAAERLVSSGMFNSNWDNSMDQSDLFESTLSSIVSSPAASHAGTMVGAGDNVMMRELIGRLGSICNSGEISPQSYIGGTNNNSTNTSCYNTPLNSPPKLNLSVMDSQIRGNFSLSGNNFLSQQNLAPFSADPGFAERAARFSCFGSRNLGSLNGKFASNEAQELANRSTPGAGVESGKLSRVSNNKSFNIAGIGSQMGVPEGSKNSIQNGNLASNKKLNRFSRSSTPENAGDSQEGSSVSEQLTGGELGLKTKAEANTRKRKPVHTGEVKDIKAVAENQESKGKKIKPEEVSKKDMAAVKGKAEAKDGTKAAADANQKQANDNSKLPEPPKDYIHVRARRGQATDSHSLAERVRREKISKRMKFLQDLVPGCNKVTGKAVMLDEIINYVQSLQRQVEFLSMKLSTVNPRMELNMETLLPKDIFKSSGSLPHPFYPMDSSMATLPYEYQSMNMPSLHNGLSNGSEKPFPVASASNVNVMLKNLSGQLLNGYGEAGVDVSKFWEDELHSVVQMGYGQNQVQNVNDQMKSEL